MTKPDSRRAAILECVAWLTMHIHHFKLESLAGEMGWALLEKEKPEKMTHPIYNELAFPHTSNSDSFPGMTLRDWFAGQALAGFMANTQRPTTIAEDDAVWCYRIADAMLAERMKK
jgi:hypothetical protein